MKKTILALTLLALSSNLAYSEEVESELMEAPAEYVLSLLAPCKEDAEADEVTELDMKKYLLTCLNDELELGYYKPIKVLPKEE